MLGELRVLRKLEERKMWPSLSERAHLTYAKREAVALLVGCVKLGASFHTSPDFPEHTLHSLRPFSGGFLH